MENPLIIYHDNCLDGIVSAWIMNALFAGRCELHAGVYGVLPPYTDDRDVILVDFSYKRSVIVERAKYTRSILILDHHASAIDDLKDLPEGVTFISSLEQSGAGLAFEYASHNNHHLVRGPENWQRFIRNHPSADAVVKLVEDYDLWRFDYTQTKAFKEGLMSQGLLTVELKSAFDILNSVAGSAVEYARILQRGETILDYRNQCIESMVKYGTRTGYIDEYRVPIINVPRMFSSDVGNFLARGHPFAACYCDTERGREYSLRSTKKGVDVSEIAKRFGGGGHRNSAGFTVPMKHPLVINDHFIDASTSPRK